MGLNLQQCYTVTPHNYENILYESECVPLLHCVLYLTLSHSEVWCWLLVQPPLYTQLPPPASHLMSLIFHSEVSLARW